MLLGWVFAGAFFVLAFVSSFLFGASDGGTLAPGVTIMVVMSSVLTVLSVYIYYTSNPEAKQ